MCGSSFAREPGGTCGWTPCTERPRKSPLQVKIVGMREGSRLLSGLTRLFCRPLPNSPTLRERSRRAPELPQCSTRYEQPFYLLKPEARLARRWSTSTLDKLRLQKLILGVAPSIARTLPSRSRESVLPIACLFPKMREPLHISSAIDVRGGDPVGTRPRARPSLRDNPEVSVRSRSAVSGDGTPRCDLIETGLTRPTGSPE